MAELRSEFSKKLVCVKTDLCTRRGRHFIGVNIQAIVEGTLRVATAGVKEMPDKATGEAIRIKVLDCLQSLEIHEQQIYTITTDNGSNVVKAAKLLKSGQSGETMNESEDEENEDWSGEGEGKEETVVTELFDMSVLKNAVRARWQRLPSQVPCDVLSIRFNWPFMTLLGKIVTRKFC